jgi:signal transduction histidine kinase
VSFIVPPDLKGEETTILHRILAEERIEHHETTRLTKTGDLVDVSITVSPVYDGGKVVGASVIARDVSDRRRLEDLQRRVDRTDFIARAVHDLRTPLTTLVGFAEILARRENLSPERRREIADTIARQGDQVNALLGDLLDLSYVESGRYEMSLERVALADVMARVLETVRRPAGKEIDVEVPDDAVVIGDPSRIGQILVNLVSNAFKYGGDHVRVIARSTGGRVTLEVTDDGRGVPEAVRDTLFEPFTRGHTDVPGTGLGLAITARLIAAHGGSIELDAEVPGCRFVIDLPGARDSERV